MMAREDLRNWHLSQTPKDMNKEPVKIWRKSTLEGNRECKVPEAEMGLVCSKKAGGQWLEECDKGDQHSRWGQREKKRPQVFERTQQPVSTPRKEKLLLAQLFCESERKIFPSRLAPPHRLSLAFHCAEVGDMATPKPSTGMTHSQGLSLPPARCCWTQWSSASKDKARVTVGWETRVPAT